MAPLGWPQEGAPFQVWAVLCSGNEVNGGGRGTSALSGAHHGAQIPCPEHGPWLDARTRVGKAQAVPTAIQRERMQSGRACACAGCCPRPALTRSPRTELSLQASGVGSGTGFPCFRFGAAITLVRGAHPSAVHPSTCRRGNTEPGGSGSRGLCAPSEGQGTRVTELGASRRFLLQLQDPWVKGGRDGQTADRIRRRVWEPRVSPPDCPRVLPAGGRGWFPGCLDAGRALRTPGGTGSWTRGPAVPGRRHVPVSFTSGLRSCCRACPHRVMASKAHAFGPVHSPALRTCAPGGLPVPVTLPAHSYLAPSAASAWDSSPRSVHAGLLSSSGSQLQRRYLPGSPSRGPPSSSPQRPGRSLSRDSAPLSCPPAVLPRSIGGLFRLSLRTTCLMQAGTWPSLAVPFPGSTSGSGCVEGTCLTSVCQIHR